MRRRLPVIAAIITGLMVAGAGLFYMLKMPSGQQESARVPVPSRDIPIFTEITAQDLEWRALPVTGFEPGAARDPNQVIGKMSAVPLYKGQQIALNRLQDKTPVDFNQQFVAVNFSSVHYDGVKLVEL